MNKVKNMWYDEGRRLLADGYHVSINGKTCKTEIFESTFLLCCGSFIFQI